MNKNDYILVRTDVAPGVMLSVLEAKRLLTAGEAKSISEAIKVVGISRSVFYKYKDCVYAYGQRASGRIITLLITLKDQPGVLSSVIGKLYQSGANILTLNQNMPIGGTALVNISARTDHLMVEENDLLRSIEDLEGVQSIVSIANE